MIGELVRKLFGVRNPDDLMRERMKEWNSWLTPLPPKDVGRDPGYEDAFLLVRDEVAKLSDNNDALIVDSCSALLMEVGKDLRLAGYYAFARLHGGGPSAFADGLELTAALIERFGEALFPLSSKAKKGALEWLSTSRIIDLIELGGGFAAEDMERAVAAYNAIVTRTDSWDSAARPSLHRLFDCLMNAASVSHTSQLAEAAAYSPLPTAESVASSRDLLDQARMMATWLRSQPDNYGYLPAARLIRCVRWDNLTEPPIASMSGQTRLPPPRPELRQHLKRMELQQQWPEMLERIEGLFTEGANHLWLDLQYFQNIALKRAGHPYNAWSELFAHDLALTIERLTGLERLTYNDGTPFADDTTLEWIERDVRVRRDPSANAPAVIGPTAGSDGDPWMEIEHQAGNLMAANGLEAAFEWLQGLGLPSGRQRFRQRRFMAALADQMGKTEMALHLLGELDLQCEELNLSLWEPELVFDVKHALLRLLKSAANRKDADKAALGQRIGKLSASLMVLDPARALASGF